MNDSISEVILGVVSIDRPPQVEAVSDTKGLDGEAVLGEALQRQTPTLLAAARALLRNEADARDLVQATLEIASCKAGDLRDPAALRAWLLAIQVREAFRIRRRLGPSSPPQPRHRRDLALPRTRTRCHCPPHRPREVATAGASGSGAPLPGGPSYKAHWKCHRCGHTWEALVGQRTMRQTRCQRCYTERADGRNCLAAVHPDLIPEWDDEANKPLRPTRIKSTYDKAVYWKCRDDPTHPNYKMSVATRSKKPVGCPICRKKKPSPTTSRSIAAA